MAEIGTNESHEIFIIKHHHGDHSEHHGGAWKIAFADFMTAMMTLFLVLWLISSTSEKQKHTVAQYFNPVKLVDVATLKKGFRDQKETEMGSGPSSKQPEREADAVKRKQPPGLVGHDNPQGDAKARAARESSLFRDPYGVLAEIATSTQGDQSHRSQTKASTAVDDTVRGFADPFTTIPREEGSPLDSVLPAAQGEAAGSSGEDGGLGLSSKDAGTGASQVQASQTGTQDGGSSRQEQTSKTSQQKLQKEIVSPLPAEPKTTASDVARLKSIILHSLNDADHTQGLPHVEVQQTGEGILISLTDDVDFSMFAIGSAEPHRQTVQIMEKIGRALKGESGAIVIRGHTDGRPYKSELYDNWRLSEARAQMALYMLTRSGLNEKRIEKIEGYADHRLKSPANPNGSENRRIEILLRSDKP